MTTSDCSEHNNNYSVNLSSINDHSSQQLMSLSLKRQQSTSSDQNFQNTSRNEVRAKDIIPSKLNTTSTVAKHVQPMNSVSNGTSRSSHFDGLKRF
jgi:hypothetical protein